LLILFWWCWPGRVLLRLAPVAPGAGVAAGGRAVRGHAGGHPGGMLVPRWCG